jgi:hypothetical protein
MPIEADMMLCESATLSGGSLSLLGAGWQVRPGLPITQSAVAVILKVPRKQAGAHDLRLELLDYEDNLVSIDPPQGPGEMVIEGQIVVAGIKDPSLKTPLLGAFAVNLPPFPLEAGREYQWRLHVDGKTRTPWTLPFRTMSPAELAETLGGMLPQLLPAAQQAQLD